MRRSSTTRIAWVLLLGLLWGLNWPAIKVLLGELPPLTIRAISFPCAALILALVVRNTKQRLVPDTHEWVPLAITGGFLIFGFNVLSTIGQLFTEASRAAIVAYTMPAITGLLAVVFLKEQLTVSVIMALVTGMIGLGVLILDDLNAFIDNPLGTMIMLSAALVWSIGNVLLKARAWSIQPLALTVWFFVIATALVWPLVLVLEPPWQLSAPSASVLMVLCFHVLGPMVICYTIWTTLVNTLPTTIAALSALTAPVVGVVSATLVLDEPLTWQKSLALALIVLSVTLTFKSVGTKRES